MEVDGLRARLFVHGAEQPTLVVNDLKQTEADGGIALWIDNFTVLLLRGPHRHAPLTPAAGRAGRRAVLTKPTVPLCAGARLDLDFGFQTSGSGLQTRTYAPILARGPVGLDGRPDGGGAEAPLFRTSRAEALPPQQTTTAAEPAPGD